MSKLTAAICTFNRADRLRELVNSLRRQHCPVSWDILFIDNNSTDKTQVILGELAAQKGAPLRFVREKTQGITFARNRAIAEAIESDYLFFMDDDELPSPGILAAVHDALYREGADCVGGRIDLAFPPSGPPVWLVDELTGFLGKTNHGTDPLWITDTSTPIWTGNIAYRTSIFREDPALRFDHRYNREGSGVGGGEDAIMFRELIARQMRIRYRPDMVVEHHVEDWRLKRNYFLMLHFYSGRTYGRFQLEQPTKCYFGVPPFLVSQAVKHLSQSALMALQRDRLALRQAMTTAHAVGTIRGCYLRWRNGNKDSTRAETIRR